MQHTAILTFTNAQTNGLALYYGTKGYNSAADAQADVLALQAELGGTFTSEAFTTRERHLEILYACSANHDKLYYPEGIDKIPALPIIEEVKEFLFDITDEVTGDTYEIWADCAENAFYGACEGFGLDSEHEVAITQRSADPRGPVDEKNAQH